jgi:hypothetical protein
MPRSTKNAGDDEPVEDLQEKGARFKVEGDDGEQIEIILPPLDADR